MKKRIAILACLFATALPVVPVWGQDNKTDIQLTAGIFNDLKEMLSQSISSENMEKLLLEYEKNKCQEAIDKINLLDTSNKLSYFQNYKAIKEEYSKWLEKDKSIYDNFNSNELELLFKIVETEVRTGENGNEHFEEQANVCSVIFNRLNDEKYFSGRNTLTDVITEKSQFSSYLSGEYKKITPTENTKLACEYVFQFGDTTGGALWFDSTNGNSWADRNRSYLFKDSVGHTFYK